VKSRIFVEYLLFTNFGHADASNSLARSFASEAGSNKTEAI
jgi:hypothetical protein